MGCFRRLGKLLRIGFPEVLSLSVLQLACIVVMQGCSAYGFYEVTQITGNLVDAILEAGHPHLASIFTRAVGWSLGSTVLLVASAYMGELLQLHWRRRVVEYAHERYFRHTAVYHMNHAPDVDNTDQRLTTDVALWASSVGTLAFGSYTNFTSAWYTLVSMSISLWFVVDKLTWIPAVVSAAYAVVAMVATALLAVPVARRTYTSDAALGTLRFLHSRCAEFAEAIAMYGGFAAEGSRLRAALQAYTTRMVALFNAQAWMSTWSGFQFAFPNLLSYTAVALMMKYTNTYAGPEPPSTGRLYADAGTVALFLYAVVNVPYIMAQFGTIAGYTQRVGLLLDALDARKPAPSTALAAGASSPPDGEGVFVTGLACDTPDGHRLLSGVTFAVVPGRNVLIMGPTGCGKSSILRVIAGLWPPAAGTVTVSPPSLRDAMFFVPQRPYMTPGTLRDQLLYPKLLPSPSRPRDAVLLNLLHRVGLSHLAAGEAPLDAAAAWSTVLSVGEQQRVGFIRLLAHAPRIAVLDEATSAMDADAQATVFQLCREGGITCLSVGHRDSLRQFHDCVITVHRDGTTAHEEDGGQAAPPQVVEPDAPPPARSPLSVVVSGGGKARSPPRPVARFNALFLRRLWRLLSASFSNVLSWSTVLLVVTAGLCVSLAFVTVKVAFVPGKVFAALHARDYSQAYLQIAYGTVVYFVCAVLGALARYCGKTLSLLWYRNMVKVLTGRYMTTRRLYAANMPAANMDAVDQRVVADALQLATSLGTVLFGGESRISIMQIVATIIVSTVKVAPYGHLPTLLCWMYTLLALVVASRLLLPMVPLVYRRNLLEGSFRTTHTRVREYSECIAMYAGEHVEKRRSGVAFDSLYDAIRALLWQELPARGVNKVVAMVSTVVAYGCAAWPAMATGHLGRYPLTIDQLFNLVGLITTLIMYTASLPDYLTDAAPLAALVHRVGELFEHLQAPLPPPPAALVATASPTAVSLSGVGVSVPDGGPALLSGVSFDIVLDKPRAVLLSGPSGCGKSSLLRVIAGVWRPTAGTVHTPPLAVPGTPGGAMFVPQRPYMFRGTLRQLLVYPQEDAPAGGADDDALMQLLGALDLLHLAHPSHRFRAPSWQPLNVGEDSSVNALLLGGGDRPPVPPPPSPWCCARCRRPPVLDDDGGGEGLDAVMPWHSVLSVGEQQRVSFVRVCANKPMVVFLDEATSGLHADMEAACMRLCREVGVSVVSVGHRESLVAHHDVVVDVGRFAVH